MTDRERYLGALAALVEQRHTVDAMTDRYVMQAREAGATWQQLGQALGITRQAAQLRHARAERQREESKQ